MVKLSQERMFEKLLKFNSPSVSNVVATYPKNPHCLNLYDPWKGQWYTDQTVKCFFPEMGQRIGFAFTMAVSIPDANHPELPSLSFLDVIEALGAAPKPIIVACEQEYPSGILDKAGLFGGQSTAMFKASCVVGVVTNGPSRDID
jgi:4-hydroxy-4-methyl-2-oxoglutarate aldolase